MDIYTIKKCDSEALQLVNQSGELVSCTAFLRSLAPHRVFALDGPMGVGKTTFVKQLLRELGSDDVVNSPTFAIVNVYDIPSADSLRREEVYHFDCYRLKNIHEAIDLGAEEYLYSGCYCFIEWPDIIERLLPDDTVYLRLTLLENGDRQLIIDS